MTKFRETYERCPDSRPCFAAKMRGTERICHALRDIDYKDGQCPYCKQCITDRTDKPEPGYEPGEEPKT